jgi:hypothetical protein
VDSIPRDVSCRVYVPHINVFPPSHSKCALIIKQPRVPITGTVSTAVRFSNVMASQPLILAQVVLLKCEFNLNSCMHAEVVFVHTLFGSGEATASDLAGQTALSRGYNSRILMQSDSSARVREIDPVDADTEFDVEIPLVYTPSWDVADLGPSSSTSSAPRAIVATEDNGVYPMGPSGSSKEELAARAARGSCRYMHHAQMWQDLSIPPSLLIKRSHRVDQVPEKPSAALIRDGVIWGFEESQESRQAARQRAYSAEAALESSINSSSERSPTILMDSHPSSPSRALHRVMLRADDPEAALDTAAQAAIVSATSPTEVALRYFFRLIVQDACGRNFYATTVSLAFVYSLNPF